MSSIRVIVQRNPSLRVVGYVLLSILVHFLLLLVLSLDFSFFRKDNYFEDILDNAVPLILDLPTRQITVVVEPPVTINETVEMIEDEDEEEEPEEEVLEELPEEVDMSQNVVGAPVIEYESFYAVDTRPQFIEQATLIYPFKERRLGQEGVVIIEVDIDANGLVRDYRILKSAGTNFDQAAIDMVLNSSFSPGYRNEVPVPVRMRFPIRFQLTD